MLLWVGWVVPWLVLPELTLGPIKLEGQLGWNGQDDLIPMRGSRYWPRLSPIGSPLWSFILWELDWLP